VNSKEKVSDEVGKQSNTAVWIPNNRVGELWARSHKHKNRYEIITFSILLLSSLISSIAQEADKFTLEALKQPIKIAFIAYKCDNPKAVLIITPGFGEFLQRSDFLNFRMAVFAAIIISD